MHGGESEVYRREPIMTNEKNPHGTSKAVSSIVISHVYERKLALVPNEKLAHPR